MFSRSRSLTAANVEDAHIHFPNTKISAYPKIVHPTLQRTWLNSLKLLNYLIHSSLGVKILWLCSGNSFKSIESYTFEALLLVARLSWLAVSDSICTMKSRVCKYITLVGRVSQNSKKKTSTNTLTTIVCSTALLM